MSLMTMPWPISKLDFLIPSIVGNDIEWFLRPRPSEHAPAFDRALTRAGITSGDVTLHTLRHTALSRMIAAGYDDYTVMEISAHSSTRMLGRYTHPTDARKIGALKVPRLSRIGCRRCRGPGDAGRNQRNVAGKLVDGRRLELPTSALRMQAASNSKRRDVNTLRRFCFTHAQR
jgi:hypothetical protein